MDIRLEPPAIIHQQFGSLSALDQHLQEVLNDHQYQKACNDNKFWNGLSRCKYRCQLPEGKESAIKRYGALCLSKGEIFSGAEKTLSVDECLIRACRINDSDLVKYFLALSDNFSEETAIKIMVDVDTISPAVFKMITQEFTWLRGYFQSCVKDSGREDLLTVA